MLLLQKFIIGLVIESAFDLIIHYADKVAKRTDTDIDDNAVAKIKGAKKLIIGAIQGKIKL